MPAKPARARHRRRCADDVPALAGAARPARRRCSGFGGRSAAPADKAKQSRTRDGKGDPARARRRRSRRNG